jgi:ketosteroid isomerase-like protein
MAVVWVLALHFSHLMAKSDDAAKIWTPLVVPPGAVVVTSGAVNPRGATLSNAPVRVAQADVPSPAAPTPIAKRQAQAPESPAVNASVPADLRAALDQWREAWRGQNLSAYMNLYAADFVPAKGMSRAAWAKSRTQRIKGKKNIRLDIRDVKFRMEKTTAVVQFTQTYQDERIQMTDAKTMHWVQRDGRWWIVLERTDAA